jgi:hypothetical protein
LTNRGSSAQITLDQVDGLLGTNFVEHVSNSGCHELRSWLVTDSANSDCKLKTDAVALLLPPCARSLEGLTLFIYQHGFQDLLREDALRGESILTPRALISRRQKSQEELLKSGALRTIAKLLKQIHDCNFYRPEPDKIANAFSILIQKNVVCREVLSAEWEFFGANYHPKIPLKDKHTYLQICHDLFRPPSQQPNLVASNVKRATRQSEFAENNKPISKPRSALSNKPSAEGSAQSRGNNVRRNLRPGLRRVITSSNANLNRADECSIKQTPFYSNSESISDEIDGEIKDIRDCITARLDTMSILSGSDLCNDVPSDGRSGSTNTVMSDCLPRDSADDLPSDTTISGLMTPGLRPDEGLSILDRIDQLFPTCHKKENAWRRTKLPVQIQRLKILRW